MSGSHYKQIRRQITTHCSLRLDEMIATMDNATQAALCGTATGGDFYNYCRYVECEDDDPDPLVEVVAVDFEPRRHSPGTHIDLPEPRARDPTFSPASM
jgi:hypothetical protein